MLIKALAAAAGNAGGGGYTIDNSLRFNDNDSAYLSWTPSSAGNRKTWTFSAWVKLGNSGATRTLFAARLATSNSDSLQVYLTSNDQINVGGVSYGITATPVLRDPSGWYHIVLSYDTTQATDTNRAKIYINGIQASVTGTYPSINLDTPINNTQAHNLGRRPTENDRYFDGYMAEVNFIDGQALTADDFGQIDATTGEWSPKRYSGTYGTNGFYLAFEDSAALGDDTSGNTNDWTPTNLASTDQMLDTPTNNFATLNSTAIGSYVTLSEGNLKITGNTSTDSGAALPTIFVNEGLFYWETYVVNVGSGLSYAGFVQTNAPAIGTNNAELMGSLYGGFVRSNGEIYGANRTITTTDTYTAGDIIGVALDMTNGAAYVSKNNTWLNGGVPTSGASKTGAIFSWTPSSMIYANGPLGAAYNGEANVLNTGQDSSFAGNKTRQGNTDANGIGDFYYAPPAGYLALCTDNLPAPAIKQPETQFNVVTYTGTGSSNPVSGVGFQPDFVWIKNRSAVASNKLFDVIRGAGQQLESDTTNAESTNSNFASFDSDGFTVVGGTAYNLSGNSYVAWCWKAGGTAVTNTDGAITSQVSANVDAGFSIVTWTGTGANGTIGHGLNEAPEFWIFKSRNTAYSWYVLTPVIDGSVDYLILDSTSGANNTGGNFSIAPTSSVISLGATTGLNDTGENMLCYAFHSVEGFSKIGTYVGNGSSNGPFVYTGFKPAFVLIKRTDATSNWFLLDNERSGYNGKNDILFTEVNDAEYSGATYPRFDLLSNGFKAIHSSVSASGGNYIYMAFAEAPLKNSLGR